MHELRILFWELTARCNLRCRHCRAEAQAHAGNDELSTNEILHIIRGIKRDGADPLMILTGGEPLTRPDFFAIAHACTATFSHVALATNGTLITDALAQEIRHVGIKRVSISLDGARAETHDAFRGVSGSFAAALRGLEALRTAGLSVQINTTFTRHNDMEADRLLRLALEYGADAFHLFALVPVGCGAQMDADEQLPPGRMDDLLKWLYLRSVELQGRMQLRATCAPQYVRIAQELAAKYNMPLPPQRGTHGMSGGCLAGSHACFISRTGDVQPCGYLPLTAGTLRTQSLKAIWHNAEHFAALRDHERLTGKCQPCTFRKACQGCRARAYAVHGDYLADDPDCGYQTQKPDQAVHTEDLA